MNFLRLLSLIIIFSLFAYNPSFSQKFGFGGTAKATYETSDYKDTLSERPLTVWRLEAEPSLYLFGVPFSLLVLISSEQTDIRQNINLASFNLSFGVEKLRELLGTRVNDQITKLEELATLKDRIGLDMLQDSLRQYAPDELKDLEGIESKINQLKALTDTKIPEDLDKLQDAGMLFGAENIFLNFPSFGIGNIAPHFSEFILSGLTMNGAMAEFNPGGAIFAAAAVGKSQRAITQFGIIPDPLTTDSVQVFPTFFRNLYSGRFGFGRKEGTHLFLTGLYAKDDLSSLNDSLSKIVSPQSDYVLGLEGKISMLENRLSLSAQVNGSAITEDERASKTDGLLPTSVQAIQPNISTSIDATAQAKIDLYLPKEDTKASMNIQYVGPGYKSLGVPYLRTDYLRYEATAEQKIFSRQITFGGFYRAETDNLADLKSATTNINGYGAKIGFSFRGLPNFSVSYSPITQVSKYKDSTATTYSNTTTSLAAQASYSYPILKSDGLFGSTTLAYNQQSQVSSLSDIFGYENKALFANQTLSFAIPLTLSFGVATNSFTQKGFFEFTNEITDLNFGATYTFFGMWDNSFNVSTQSVSYDAVKKGGKVGVGLTSAFRIFQSQDGKRYGIAELHGEKNFYTDEVHSSSNHNEMLGRATMTFVW